MPRNGIKGWSEVEIPHTWNAKDMQVQANSFYEGTAYYKNNISSRLN